MRNEAIYAFFSLLGIGPKATVKSGIGDWGLKFQHLIFSLMVSSQSPIPDPQIFQTDRLFLPPIPSRFFSKSEFLLLIEIHTHGCLIWHIVKKKICFFLSCFCINLFVYFYFWGYLKCGLLYISISTKLTWRQRQNT